MNLSTVPLSARNASREHREIPRRLPHQHVGIGRFRDGGEPLDVGEHQRDLLLDAAELGGDRIVDHPADNLFGYEARERPYRPLRQIDGIAELVNLADMEVTGASLGSASV